MGTSLPLKLDDYCKHYGISFFNLRLRCIFCKHWIDTVQLAAFHVKRLTLLWRNDVCFACCTPCLTLSARYERERFYQCSVKSDFLEDILHKPLADIVIRCVDCLCMLDLIEKIEHLLLDRPFHLIRGYWRGTCRNCKRQ
ncbi:E6 [Gammapapillomavirus 12]|uniref:Protein E6 n=2 Tax=Papillomaviridae TaxID=151340 RepID=A0A2D2ALN5_9PAPI|nr:E6 [Gammapapillomavirus 12]AYA94893.1 MAG: E6 protein [Human papillomavirus]